MFNSVVTEFKKGNPQDETAWFPFRQSGRLGTELAEVDSKILEIIVDEGEEELYNRE